MISGRRNPIGPNSLYQKPRFCVPSGVALVASVVSRGVPAAEFVKSRVPVASLRREPSPDGLANRSVSPNIISTARSPLPKSVLKVAFQKLRRLASVRVRQGLDKRFQFASAPEFSRVGKRSVIVSGSVSRVLQ